MIPPHDLDLFGNPLESPKREIPPYQLLPPLTSDEYAALKADIAEHGIRVPITVDQHGVIIDGHHRAQVAHELGIPCPREVQAFADDDERHDAALALNLKRRHLSREQMRQLIASEWKRTPEASDREIARRLGCSPSTVGTVRHPVSKLDTPALSRAEAEAMTYRIAVAIAKSDRLCSDALAAGVPPEMIAEADLETWAAFVAEANDAEFTDPIWTYVVAPRIKAILNGGAR